ncbi:MAG TPA: F0F1 ATP synthase subunit A [Verrucomicrobiae bacterium]|nr:F0F1 ATP synthase subunit A [Verrucomicrobiae bacterium]
MRLTKIILALALFAAMLSLDLHAQPAAAAVTATANSAAQVGSAESAQQPAKEPAGPMVPLAPPTLFHIGPVPITNTILWSWGVVLAIVLVVQIGMRRVKTDKVPAGLQNVLEALVEGWDNLSGMILEPKVSRWVFPYAVTFFIFAIIGNFVDLMPGVGAIGYGPAAKAGETFASLPHSIAEVKVPLIRPPTSDANLTFVMATIFLVMTFVWAIRYNGVIGSIKHVFGVKVDSAKWLYPFLVLMFLFVGAMEAISIVFVRPLALAVRLYGNIYAGETLLDMTMSMKPFIAGVALSLPFYFFETFVAIVQAFVFAMLTIVFAGTLCTHADEEHPKH